MMKSDAVFTENVPVPSKTKNRVRRLHVTCCGAYSMLLAIKKQLMKMIKAKEGDDGAGGAAGSSQGGIGSSGFYTQLVMYRKVLDNLRSLDSRVDPFVVELKTLCDKTESLLKRMDLGLEENVTLERAEALNFARGGLSGGGRAGGLVKEVEEDELDRESG